MRLCSATTAERMEAGASGLNPQGTLRMTAGGGEHMSSTRCRVAPIVIHVPHTAPWPQQRRSRCLLQSGRRLQPRRPGPSSGGPCWASSQPRRGSRCILRKPSALIETLVAVAAATAAACRPPPAAAAPILARSARLQGCTHALKLRHSFKLDARTRLEVGGELGRKLLGLAPLQMLHFSAMCFPGTPTFSAALLPTPAAGPRLRRARRPRAAAGGRSRCKRRRRCRHLHGTPPTLPIHARPHPRLFPTPATRQMLHSAAPWAAMLYQLDPEDKHAGAVEMTPQVGRQGSQGGECCVGQTHARTAGIVRRVDACLAQPSPAGAPILRPQWVTYNRRFRLGREGAWWSVPFDAKLGATFSGGWVGGCMGGWWVWCAAASGGWECRCSCCPCPLLPRHVGMVRALLRAGAALSEGCHALRPAGSPHIEIGLLNAKLAAALALGLLAAGAPLSVKRKEASGSGQQKGRGVHPSRGGRARPPHHGRGTRHGDLGAAMLPAHGLPVDARLAPACACACARAGGRPGGAPGAGARRQQARLLPAGAGECGDRARALPWPRASRAGL